VRTIIDDAILCSSVATGDADRVVTLLTRAHGKVGAMARGARKSRTRFGGALSAFVVGEALLRERRAAELMLLDSFHARHDFSRLAFDVVRLGHAAYGTELVRELAPPHRPEPALFDLLVELYAVVEEAPPRADTLRAFELRLLAELGLKPAFDRCVACDRVDDASLDRAILDAARGGLLCPACAPGARGAVRTLPAAARARLLLIDSGGLAEAAARPPAPDTEAPARAALAALLAVHLPRTPRALEFLKKLREAGHGQGHGHG
jgi:DNA repair protein RecO (recombination protein O)